MEEDDGVAFGGKCWKWCVRRRPLRPAGVNWRRRFPTTLTVARSRSKQAITTDYVQWSEESFHVECLRCKQCSKLVGSKGNGDVVDVDGYPHCVACAEAGRMRIETNADRAAVIEMHRLIAEVSNTRCFMCVCLIATLRYVAISALHSAALSFHQAKAKSPNALIIKDLGKI